MSTPSPSELARLAADLISEKIAKQSAVENALNSLNPSLSSSEIKEVSKNILKNVENHESSPNENEIPSKKRKRYEDREDREEDREREERERDDTEGQREEREEDENDDEIYAGLEAPTKKQALSVHASNTPIPLSVSSMTTSLSNDEAKADPTMQLALLASVSPNTNLIDLNKSTLSLSQKIYENDEGFTMLRSHKGDRTERDNERRPLREGEKLKEFFVEQARG
jgi:hypothetical protein